MPSYALCSPLLPDGIRAEIERIGELRCVGIPRCADLPSPVDHHPDMLFFNPPCEKITVMQERYYTVNLRFFSQFGTSKTVLDRVELGSEYPRDIAFDAIGIRETLYCLEAYTSEEVKQRFSRIVNIKQGYAACSTLIPRGGIAITADKGIERALAADGMTVCRISPDGILLPGYGCGFIGGASAVVNGTTVFFGSLSDHPDGERIAEIYRVNGLGMIDFPGLPLTDYGSIRYIYTG